MSHKKKKNIKKKKEHWASLFGLISNYITNQNTQSSINKYPEDPKPILILASLAISFSN